MINPFSAERMTRRLTQSLIIKIDKFDVRTPSDLDDESKTLTPDQDLFLALKEPLVKKVEGERRSVVLTEEDVRDVLGGFEHAVRSQKMLAWSFIPIPLSILLVPVVSDIEPAWLAMSLAIGPFAVVACVLLCLAQISFIRCRRVLNELAEVYWKRGFVVSVPEQLSRAHFRKQLRIMGGPIAACVLDEVVDVVPSEDVKLSYHALTLGREVVNWSRQTENDDAANHREVKPPQGE